MGNAKNQTQGNWLRSTSVTSVLRRPLITTRIFQLKLHFMERKERYEVFIVSNVSDVIAQVGLRQKVGQARATEAAAETKTANSCWK